jgi:predicted methyltransferase
MTRAYRSATRLRTLRFLAVLAFVSVGAFLFGTRFIIAPPRLVHPTTGRVIPGIATDVAWLDRAEREREEAPDRALALIGITPGMSVADIGAGSGYMTVRLSRLVGSTGRVYANDLQPSMLHVIDTKVREGRLGNVEIVQGTEDDTRIPGGAVDLALLVDVYHEFWHPQAMVRSIHRCLRAGGRLVLVEYRKEDPTIPIAITHRMSVAEARAEIEGEGFTFDRVNEDLPRQHIIIFRKPASE